VPLQLLNPGAQPQVPLGRQVCPAPQLVSVRHCKQVLVVVLQYGVFPPQVVSSTHWTQVCVVVLQEV
jgi:hypothetical protein